MIELSTLMALAALGAVLLAWLLPARLAMDGVAAWTACVLILLSWWTAVWLIGASVLTSLILAGGDRLGSRNVVAGGWAACLVLAFVLAQTGTTIVWIGAGFFTLRLLHVTGEWWIGRLATPGVRRHLRYQLFLPVLFVGPIHRIAHFERQVARRRWDGAVLLAGAERALIGFFLASVIGGFAAAKAQQAVWNWAASMNSFTYSWSLSAIDWIRLYFVFAGLTSVALGISLMIGLELEENFNRPWRATSLIDFWTRWHMSLTSWCRDYVFRPVMATSRSALLGLAAAMLVIGLWHELSLYYLLWAAWQTLGVSLNRLAARLWRSDALPQRVLHVVAPPLILAWLSLARPVISHMLAMS